MKGEMNLKRISISIVLGFVFGAVCLFGTMSGLQGQLLLPILATIFYHRVLLGLVVVVACGLPFNPVPCGAASALSSACSLPYLQDSRPSPPFRSRSGYGVITDCVATRFS